MGLAAAVASASAAAALAVLGKFNISSRFIGEAIEFDEAWKGLDAVAFKTGGVLVGNRIAK